MENGPQQLKVGTDRQEMKEHGSFDFPVRISDEKLFAMYGGAFLWHWHTQIELTLVLDGEIRYRVNDHVCHSKPGQGMVCFATAMRCIWGKALPECGLQLCVCDFSAQGTARRKNQRTVYALCPGSVPGQCLSGDRAATGQRLAEPDITNPASNLYPGKGKVTDLGNGSTNRTLADLALAVQKLAGQR